MSNRVLKRPMFRRGGMANQGIMSGLEDRSGYQDGGEALPYLQRSGLGKTLSFLGDSALNLTGAVMDTVNVPINKASEFFLGYNPGLSARRNQREIKDSLFGKDRPGRLTDEEVNVAEIFGIDTDAKPTGPFVGLDPGSGGTAMASEVDPNENNPDNNTTINNNDGETVDNNTGEPVSAADDVKTIYEDILPLLQSTLGVDDSELKKQRYLELAKFGASLMAQPGGSLTRAIGAAAQEPLEGLTRIAETKRQGKRKPAEAAINVALDIYKNKANNPTMQKIKTIASLSGRSEKEVADTFLTSTGEEQIKAAQITYIAEGARKNLGLDEGGSLNFTDQIQKLMDAGLNSLAGKFTETLPDREDLGEEEIGNYYVDTNGDLVRWDGSKFLYISDAGFADKKKKK